MTKENDPIAKAIKEWTDKQDKEALKEVSDKLASLLETMPESIRKAIRDENKKK